MGSNSPENILLYLGEENESYIKSLFAELAVRGFPIQTQHPHISITFSPKMDPQVVDMAAQILPPVVPSTFARVGTIVFGTKRKQTVAWLLEADEKMERVARQISAANPDGRGDRWVPHLTMGLRLQRSIVPDYIRALDELVSPHFKEIQAVRAGFWQPDSGTFKLLAS